MQTATKCQRDKRGIPCPLRIHCPFVSRDHITGFQAFPSADGCRTNRGYSSDSVAEEGDKQETRLFTSSIPSIVVASRIPPSLPPPPPPPPRESFNLTLVVLRLLCCWMDGWQFESCECLISLSKVESVGGLFSVVWWLGLGDEEVDGR